MERYVRCISKCAGRENEFMEKLANAQGGSEHNAIDFVKAGGGDIEIMAEYPFCKQKVNKKKVFQKRRIKDDYL